MKKTQVFAVLVCLLLLAFNASLVFAAPPLSLHIEVTELIGSGPEIFYASGTAVDNSLVCETGDVDDIGISSNNPGGPFQTLWITKQFDCGDGTFDVKMVVKLNLITHDTKANWKIVSGTGAYHNLKGNGKLVGTSIVPGVSILDVYDGKVH
jgi:hypothetical protein